jgi:SARP family transcriptional regulator, regulator of embCAB operon
MRARESLYVRAWVTICGGISVRFGDLRADERVLGGPQGRLVFTFLALERRRAVHREELADALWPGRRPRTWGPALRVVVSRVRGFLRSAGLADGDVLQTAGCYQLCLGVESVVDVEELRHRLDVSERALATGDDEAALASAGHVCATTCQLLPGIDSPWIDRKRDELRAWRIRALEVVSDGALRAGRPAVAVQAATDLIALEPYHESAHRRLMVAHAACGNRAEAVLAYERCRRLLGDEMGIVPDHETRTLHHALLRER